MQAMGKASINSQMICVCNDIVFKFTKNKKRDANNKGETTAAANYMTKDNVGFIKYSCKIRNQK